MRPELAQTKGPGVRNKPTKAITTTSSMNMTQKEKSRVSQDEQGALVPDLDGYTREGVIAWIRANGLECGPEAPTSESRRAAVIAALAHLRPGEVYKLETVRNILGNAGVEIVPPEHELKALDGLIWLAHPSADGLGTDRELHEHG